MPKHINAHNSNSNTDTTQHDNTTQIYAMLCNASRFRSDFGTSFPCDAMRCPS